jgi:hypothetical protein
MRILPTLLIQTIRGEPRILHESISISGVVDPIERHLKILPDRTQQLAVACPLEIRSGRIKNEGVASTLP